MNLARSSRASSLLIAAGILCLSAPAWSMRPTEVAPCRPNMPQEVRSFPGPIQFVYSAGSARDGRTVLAGGEDGALRAWEATTGKDLFKFAAPE